METQRKRGRDSEIVFLLRTNYWIHLQRRYCLLLKMVWLTRLLTHLNFAPKYPFHWQSSFVNQSADALSEYLQ